MNDIYFFSGPCGVGKSTVSELFAKRLAQQGHTACLIHGDDFHASVHAPREEDCFTEDGSIRDPESWNRIIRFNWKCLLDMAGNALDAGMDVVIDYVIEEELPLLTALANARGVKLYYYVLSASREALTQRVTNRGDPETAGRSLFLKEKLEKLPESQGHVVDTTGVTPESLVTKLQIPQFRVQL